MVLREHRDERHPRVTPRAQRARGDRRPVMTVISTTTATTSSIASLALPSVHVHVVGDVPATTVRKHNGTERKVAKQHLDYPEESEAELTMS